MKHLLLLLALGLSLAACGDDEPKNEQANNAQNNQGEPDADEDADAEQDVGQDAEQDATQDAPEDAAEDLPDGPQGLILGVPKTETWEFEGLQDEVHVVRTEGNVPHIYAKNTRDLYFVEGFVMARDRYLEFELGRRVAAGRVGELLGDDALEIDQLWRGLGRSALVQQVWDKLSAEQQDIFNAYADGINAYIQSTIDGQTPAPTEVQLAGPLLGGGPAQLMKPVTGRDVVSFVGFLIAQLGFDMDDLGQAAALDTLPTRFEGAPLGELRRAGARQDMFEQVKPARGISSAAGWGIERGGESKPSAGRGHKRGANKAARPQQARPKAVPASMLAGLLERGKLDDKLRRRGEGGEFGSNGWAVGAQGTQGGGSLLAGDGHLPLGIPSIFFQMALDTQLFGGGDIHQIGLVFPGLPIMTVGTNGRVAWTQTYLYADVTDWYREEIQLGEDGKPAASRFQGEWRPLNRVEEEYTLANVPALGSVGRTETWERWTLFDGRPLTSVEGRVLALDEEPADGEVVVTMLGARVVPGDLDNDGVVTGISFDYTGFDFADTLGAVDGFHKSNDLDQWREQTHKLVGYAQSISAADDQGNVTYTGYNGIPCRNYLPRDEQGRWVEGADPRRLLDGTTYRGFEIPVNAQGRVDESQGEADPYKCVIPFEEFPQALNPDRGFILNANNDPGNITTDGSIYDDPWYMGYAWDIGYRANTIHTTLEQQVQTQSATVQSMADLQGDIRSNLGRELGPELIASIQEARGLRDLDRVLQPWEQRLSELYEADAEGFDEVERRLAAWIEREAPARSGVQTFYAQPDEADRQDAVATMIFNAWLRSYYANTLGDEQVEDLWVGNPSANRTRTLLLMLAGRGAENPGGLASWNPDTQESAFFDVLATEPVERSREVALLSLKDALAFLRGPSSGAGVGGFGTEDMDQWLWGLRHQARLPSILTGFVSNNPAVDLIAGPLSISTQTLPLEANLPQGDPRKALKWFPRDGDFFAVDAANPGWLGDQFSYQDGPVMRMVIHLKDGRVQGQNVLPGGQSAITSSPYFADQARLWLANEAMPLRFHPEDVAAGATGRELYKPK
jgi:penicillin amidase